ncbi:MAG TPA: MscL family protein [Candidatus Saccharimonadales bacterium]|nr:MscL family protein [Candidatus Saccharimonadales bacterium]
MADQKTAKQPVRKEVVIMLPPIKAPRWLQGFTDFVREQGVVGLAVGFVLGTQVKTLVDQFVTSFINPILGLLLPGSGKLVDKTWVLSFNSKTQDVAWGAFAFQLVSFFIVALIVYFSVKGLKLDKIDKKKA